MSIPIIIQGTTVDFPSSAQSPNWAPAIIQFAQLVESALSGLVGAFDISPQVFSIDSYNPGTNVDITNLSFSTSNVRCAFINYSVYRTTSTANASEGGDIVVVYNPNNSVGNKWAISQVKTDDGQIEFNITDTGQVQFTTTALSGINHSGSISFFAKALLQS